MGGTKGGEKSAAAGNDWRVVELVGSERFCPGKLVFHSVAGVLLFTNECSEGGVGVYNPRSQTLRWLTGTSFATQSKFYWPRGIAVDRTDNSIIVAEYMGCRIVRIAGNAALALSKEGDNVIQTANESATVLAGIRQLSGQSDGPFQSATFPNLTSVDCDRFGDVYAFGNHSDSIRRLNMSSRTVSTIQLHIRDHIPSVLSIACSLVEDDLLYCTSYSGQLFAIRLKSNTHTILKHANVLHQLTDLLLPLCLIVVQHVRNHGDTVKQIQLNPSSCYLSHGLCATSNGYLIASLGNNPASIVAIDPNTGQVTTLNNDVVSLPFSQFGQFACGFTLDESTGTLYASDNSSQRILQRTIPKQFYTTI
jgi:hypothetical protein